MMKALVFLKKRSDLTLDQFVDYYENHHSHLIRRLLPTIGEYRRNYLRLGGEALGAHREVRASDHPGFDVVTEIWFADQAAWESFLATIATPDVAAEIAADELNFLDRPHTRLIAVDEYIHQG